MFVLILYLRLDRISLLNRTRVLFYLKIDVDLTESRKAGKKAFVIIYFY